MTANPPSLQNKNRRIAVIIICVVVLMIGASFAFVPLYNLFCRVTGFDGTPLTSGQAAHEVIDRAITVKFDANTARGLRWEFKPEKREATVRLGENLLIAYMAHNLSDETVTGTALYNITPQKAAKYFHKMECFCFAEQALKPGEKARLPVTFYVDPALDSDPDMADLTSITLSYSFFKVNSSALDKALEDFYNQPVK